MTNPYSGPLTYPASPIATVPAQQVVVQEKKKTAAPYVIGGLAVGAGTGALVGWKSNPYISKSGEVVDSFAREAFEKYVNKHDDNAKKIYTQSKKVLEEIKNVKTPEGLKTLLDNNKEFATELCKEIETSQTPDKYIKTITQDNLRSNKEDIIQRTKSMNNHKIQSMKNWIQACWDKTKKEFKKSADVTEDAFNAIKESTKTGKNKLIAKYAAIGGVAAALVSFVTYKIVQAKKARKQALASSVPPAHVQTVNIR